MNTPNAISSAESQDGHLPSALLDGPKTRKSGREAVRASRIQGSGAGLVTLTRGIFGPYFGSSSKPGSLQECLVNRLMARLDGIGSPMCCLTWNPLIIKPQRLLYALRASQIMCGQDSFGLLPTPPASEFRDWSRPEILAALDRGGRVARRICSLSASARSHPAPVGLNHSFALAMMGFPPAWSDALARATPLTRKSPLNL